MAGPRLDAALAALASASSVHRSLRMRAHTILITCILSSQPGLSALSQTNARSWAQADGWRGVMRHDFLVRAPAVYTAECVNAFQGDLDRTLRAGHSSLCSNTLPTRQCIDDGISIDYWISCTSEDCLRQTMTVQVKEDS